MARFIEFIDGYDVKHSINEDWISDFYAYDQKGTSICIGIPNLSSDNNNKVTTNSRIIHVKETYDKVKAKLDD